MCERGRGEPDGGVEGHSAELGTRQMLCRAPGLRTMVTCSPVNGTRRSHGALTCRLGSQILTSPSTTGAILEARGSFKTIDLISYFSRGIYEGLTGDVANINRNTAKVSTVCLFNRIMTKVQLCYRGYYNFELRCCCFKFAFCGRKKYTLLLQSFQGTPRGPPIQRN